MATKKTKPPEGLKVPRVSKVSKDHTNQIVTEIVVDAAPTKKKIGRPSKYTPELADEICQRLSNGEPLRQICRDDHMPFWTRIYDWMSKDEKLSISIAHAREVGQDAIAEDIFNEMMVEPERILSEGGGRIDSGYVQLIKARAEIKLKLLAKWNPKRYGDRVQLAGSKDEPMEHKVEVVSLFDGIMQNLELSKQVKVSG
jgi:hypothetical protein